MSMKEEVELCQAFSQALLTVKDVDEQDADLPQLCSQYVKDIYNYLHVLEVIYSLSHSDASLHRCASCVPSLSVSTGAAGCTSKLHAGL